MAMVRFYYTETFADLIAAHGAEIDRRLIEVPLALRAGCLAPLIAAPARPDPETLWEILRAYLDRIEMAMADVTRRHSPAYWLHLYRRIAPVLSSRHTGKRDETTVALVRQIAELAYLKHGDLARTDDLGPIALTGFATFLGGHYKTAMTRALGSAAKAQAAYKAIRAVDQTVMVSFDEEDLLAVFEVEGLAYEYWKSSAAMRSLGKAARLMWDVDKQWFVDEGGGPDPLLFALFDHRITAEGGLFTRLGTWTEFAAAKADFATLQFALYNPNGEIDEFPVWDPIAQEVAYGPARLNFRIGRAPLQVFRDGHAFMAPAFEKRHGLQLDAVLFCLQIASFFCFYPDRAIFSKDKNERNRIILGNLTNLSFRGYKYIGLNIESIAEEALWWARAMGDTVDFDPAEVRAAFEFLLLDVKNAALIGLWSGGKRPLLLPVHNGLLIDAAAFLPILTNLFFGVREPSGEKGFIFEDSARSMLRAAGLDIVFAGEITLADGSKREIDAAIRIGDRLILVECFSFEKPVDYELAKPGIFAKRIERVAAKVEQARSLAEVVAASPKGTNFDFSWAVAIDWRLATPSVEFAWKLDKKLFDADGVPRVLQLSELSRFLTDERHPAESFKRAVAAALTKDDLLA